ncbi:MAG TPA: SRPBCC domain-containing protein [Thermoleophilaceae bacterium]|nr:SRPBCC domain-containing protein [Thermoleophilaceae bacterium]
MRQEVEREIELDAEPADVWRELTESDWLGDDPVIELEPGGDLEFTDRDAGRRSGWVEEVEPGRRLTVWWSSEGEESSRVEFEILKRGDGSALRVTETRPLADLTVPTAMAMA